jgi:hypothetical protein
MPCAIQLLKKIVEHTKNKNTESHLTRAWNVYRYWPHLRGHYGRWQVSVQNGWPVFTSKFSHY